MKTKLNYSSNAWHNRSTYISNDANPGIDWLREIVLCVGFNSFVVVVISIYTHVVLLKYGGGYLFTFHSHLHSNFGLYVSFLRHNFLTSIYIFNPLFLFSFSIWSRGRWCTWNKKWHSSRTRRLLERKEKWSLSVLLNK